MAEQDKPKEDMVSVPKSQLEEMMERIKAVEKDRDLLLQVADKKQLGVYYSRNRDKLPSRVMLRVMDFMDKDGRKSDKVILGWRTTQDEVYQDPATMRWVEKQKVELLYEDGTAEELWLMDYVRKYKQVEAEIKSKTTDEVTGNVALKVVRIDNQKEYTIGVNFIN